MTNIFPACNSHKDIEEYLVSKRDQIQKQLETLEQDDPVLAFHSIESSELGTDAWQADAHAKIVVLKNNLMDLSYKVERSLKRIKIGTYEQCEKCGEKIGSARLAAIPMATLCAVCVGVLSKRL